ncbi:hypothetical protein GCM10010172_67090 [Paractinoplanes ferrugineus]|uniref:Uncharacterized protein n=1 Tax=Paractinoplanes ferrugineus TaxID=113564 RepID=A0A919J387_9ACTN|nr:hypothetical protein Afe05nite_49700 [Actinoplanes ferrugineus]
MASVATVAPASVASAHTTPDPADPASYDFADCPAPPPGLDPTTWRCEVHLATGEITIGRTRLSGIPMRLVHAEGPLPDGTTGQVFGTLQSRPTAVPRGEGERGLIVRVRYAGYADLVGNGTDPGGLYLMLAVRGPGLGEHCTIGTLADPIRTHTARVGATTTVPTVPPIKQFTLQDTAFTVPSAGGCAGHDHRLDTRFGLPSAAGNTLTLQAAYTYRMYSSAGRIDTAGRAGRPGGGRLG